MTLHRGTVHIVDDEPEMVKALARLLRYHHFVVRDHASARAFLAGPEPEAPACLVLDVSMPELTGLELQHELRVRGLSLPIIFLTAHGDIPMSVRAMKSGAFEFLTKPVDGAVLIEAVHGALASSEERRRQADDVEAMRNRLALLTPRERQVMERVVAGRLNKQIAAELGTGLQNIKFHRSNMMRKLGVESVAELVRALHQVHPAP